jgi:RNA polymerase subunit RPABC4/transcription elongation factor Spt4
VLELDFTCTNCGEPIAEAMQNCPWCGHTGNSFASNSAYSQICPDCERGVLPEWPYCPWCYSAGFEHPEPRVRPHRSYRAECRRCHGRLMRFMRYCPWCRGKVRIKWHVRPFPETCSRCRWSVDSNYWSYCPWCRLKLTS